MGNPASGVEIERGVASAGVAQDASQEPKALAVDSSIQHLEPYSVRGGDDASSVGDKEALALLGGKTDLSSGVPATTPHLVDMREHLLKPFENGDFDHHVEEILVKLHGDRTSTHQRMSVHSAYHRSWQGHVEGCAREA